MAAQDQTGSSDIASEITNRIRVVESKQNLFNERLLLVNQNVIDEYKKFVQDIKSVRGELEELRKDLKNVKNVVKHLSEEAANFARKDDLKVLEKYINLWNPLNFVTKEEVDKMLHRKKPAAPKTKKEGVKVAKPSSNR